MFVKSSSNHDRPPISKTLFTWLKCFVWYFSLPQSGASSWACQGRGCWRTTSDPPAGWRLWPCVRALCTPSPICEENDKVLACGAPDPPRSASSCQPLLEPLIFCEVEVVFHVQQHLSDETQPLLLKLLALLEHLLHALYVGLSATVQLVQNLLVLFFSLGWNITFLLHNILPSAPLFVFFSCSVIQEEQGYASSLLVHLISPSRSPACTCPVCRGVSSAGQRLRRLLPCCLLLGWRPASPPCRPCGRTSWQPRAKQPGTLIDWFICFLALGLRTVVGIETSFLTSFSFLAQGFWAFLKFSSASLVSLNPPIICLWYVSFCQFFTFSKSTFIRLFFTPWWSSLTFSASVMRASQARSTVPYWGPDTMGKMRLRSSYRNGEIRRG